MTLVDPWPRIGESMPRPKLNPARATRGTGHGRSAKPLAKVARRQRLGEEPVGNLQARKSLGKSSASPLDSISFASCPLVDQPPDDQPSDIGRRTVSLKCFRGLLLGFYQGTKLVWIGYVGQDAPKLLDWLVPQLNEVEVECVSVVRQAALQPGCPPNRLASSIGRSRCWPPALK